MSLSKILIHADQKKHLREATIHFRGIEKPLKNGPTIETLQDLISALHKEFETDYVNIEMVNHIMLAYKSNPKEWQKFAKFDRFKYTRNLVDAGNGRFNLMILCWGESHSSTIHDHSDSHCFMKMLQGHLVETRYEMPFVENGGDKINYITEADIGQGLCDITEKEFDENGLREIGQSIMGVDDVCYINDNLGLHRVENPYHTETAISLHLYCPPFQSCSVFLQNSGQRIVCPVTFYSKYGVRQLLE